MGTIWEQMLYLRHNKIIQPMKATAFIRKTASKNDTNSVATIYFRLRDGKKDIKAASVENIKSLDPLLYSKLTHQKNIRIK